MGKDRPVVKDAGDVATLLSALHLTKPSHAKSPHAPNLPPRRRPLYRHRELLHSIILDLSMSDKMDVDEGFSILGVSNAEAETDVKTEAETEMQVQVQFGIDMDYPILLQLSDLLFSSAFSTTTDPWHKSTSTSNRIPRTTGELKSCLSLIRSIALPNLSLHLSLLRHWQSTVSRFLTSPLFQTHEYASHRMLTLSMQFRPLHLAILAVCAVHIGRTGRHATISVDGEGEGGEVQVAYKLRARADRGLKFPSPSTSFPFSSSLPTAAGNVGRRSSGTLNECVVATHLVLAVFDGITGNSDAWIARLSQSESAVREAGYTAAHPVGRYVVWSLARMRRVVEYLHHTTTMKGSVGMGLHGADVLREMKQGYGNNGREGDEKGDGVDRRMDRVGALYAELLQISSSVAQLSHTSNDEEFDKVDGQLSEWKEKFPISLQTYTYSGPINDGSCFLHGLTSDGGHRAIALHLLFSEVMIVRLSFTPVEFQKAKVHEHAMTICRLAQSLTNPETLLQEHVPAVLSGILGSLYVAGHHLFSSDGKKWLERMLRWIATVSGDLTGERMADQLSDHWRELRTRPRGIDLGVVDGSGAGNASTLIASLTDCKMDDMDN